MPTDNPMDMIRVQANRYGVLSLHCTAHDEIWEQATDVLGEQPAEPSQALADLIYQAQAHVRDMHSDVSRETSRVDVSTFDQAPGTAYLPGRDVSRETCADEWQPAHGAGTRPGECATCWDGRPASDAGA